MPQCAITNMPFEISAFEREFLTRIAPTFAGKRYAIPEPALSPEERLRIRVGHRNEQFFYHRTSALSGEKIVSLYAPETDVPVYGIAEWFQDSWNALDYGQQFDFSRSFFEQFAELSRRVPKPALTQVQNENSPYSTGTGYCKNCYLINSSEYCEDCYYGKLLQNCTDVLDSAYCYDSELLYECFNVRNCYNSQYLYNSQNCRDCAFSDDLNGCKNCFLCTNLHQKQYYFQNEQLSQKEYEEKIREFSGYARKQKALELFSDLRKNRICKYATIINSENCTGDFIRNSKNCIDCYDVNDSEDCQYVHVGVEVKDLLDCSNMYLKPELCYQVMSSIELYNVHFSLHVFHSSDVLYSEHCHSCQHCFGCSGLRNKQYCIFNVQYTKEEYEQQVARIIEHMQQTGEWGQMFPLKHSLFAYNETLANEYLPLSEEQATERGYEWRTFQEPNFSGITRKIAAEQLPDTIQEIPDDILTWLISGEASARPFRIQKPELAFYRQQHIPIPHLHPDERQRKRMKLRNARKLWERECMECHKKIHTSYAPEQPETVYCEECYQQCVYG